LLKQFPPAGDQLDMLEFTQVQKNYGALRVLDIPHFQLEAGLYWLQGPNGAGKTTLLRIIAGILRFKGDLCLSGHSLRKDPVGYRQLVSWGDAEPLYPGFLSGVDLLSFYRQLLRPEPDQVENLCDQLGIGSWLGARAAVWSSGMTKKISLLLALLGRPALVVLDEPFITLDQSGFQELSTLIGEYHRQYGTAFLLSSHQDMGLPGLHKMKIVNHSIQLTS
jgi:ABC-2 type transport system ATP-binding protein